MPLPLPVTVVTGFLGSGKTSLINRLLAGDHGLRLAVLVNDFGEIALDASLIESEGDGLLTLANGCMCCQIGGALYDTIDRIIRSADLFDHIVIETSGVADPNPIAQIAIAEPDLAFHQTVTLVDAVNADDVRRDLRLADTFERQLRGADLIAVTKEAVAGEECTRELVRELQNEQVGKPVIRLGLEDDLAVLLEEAAAPSATARDAYSLAAQHGQTFDSLSWQGDQRIDPGDLREFLMRHDLAIYRAKGRFRAPDGKYWLVHKAGRQFSMTPDADTDGAQAIVFIGARPTFDAVKVKTAWKACTS